MKCSSFFCNSLAYSSSITLAREHGSTAGGVTFHAFEGEDEVFHGLDEVFHTVVGPTGILDVPLSIAGDSSFFIKVL